MAFQEGALIRSAKLNAFNTSLVATATLKIFSGAEPVNCAAADPSGTLLTMSLPASPFGSASSGVIALNGSWSVAASGSGAAASFRIYDSSANCAFQGNCTTDLVLNNTNIASGQTVTITAFGVTSGNA